MTDRTKEKTLKRSKDAVPTQLGWVNPKTGELLVSIRGLSDAYEWDRTEKTFSKNGKVVDLAKKESAPKAEKKETPKKEEKPAVEEAPKEPEVKEEKVPVEEPKKEEVVPVEATDSPVEAKPAKTKKTAKKTAE